MQVKEIMTQDVEVIRPEATLQEAAEKMQERKIGVLPVCDGDRVVGMLSDKDVNIRTVGDDPTQTKVQDAMLSDVVYCFEDAEVEEAAKLMQEKQLRRLVVLSREKRLAGIVSLADLAGRYK
ncbi:MAG: CBS domain-containing protein [Candidatus Manganitrophus sp. SB1]|nr:CBS domain-containing protein [Candidatus Manganitrophus morganii]